MNERLVIGKHSWLTKSYSNISLLIPTILIIWLAFSLRLHNLSTDSFWIDEIFTLETSQKGFAESLNERDHPPLVYLLTTTSLNLLNEDEFSARIPMVFAGILAVPLLILLGKLMGRPTPGLWAGLLLAFSFYHVRWSQYSRHYALLMTLSLASFVFLYVALARPGWFTWLIYSLFTITNLYTHYGALVVLASQIVLMGLWILIRWQQGLMDRSNLRYPLAAGLLVMVLYLPWLSRLRIVLNANIGERVVTGTGVGGTTNTIEWVDVAIRSFNINSAIWPYFMLLLVIFGFLILAGQRDWTSLSFLLTALVLPILIVSAFNLARGASGRYIIYILPFYYLVVGITLTELLERVLRPKLGKAGVWVGGLGLIVLIILLALPALRREYSFEQEDWKGILAYLDETANPNDVLLLMSLNFRNGFNHVDASLPFHLQTYDANYTVVSGNEIAFDDLNGLDERSDSVWAVIYDWNQPPLLERTPLEWMAFQTNLYVTNIKDQELSSLDQVTELYNTLIPLAPKIEQQCLMRKDRVYLLAASQEFDLAEAELNDVQEHCPAPVNSPTIGETGYSLYQKMMQTYRQENRLDEARVAAKNLLVYDRKNQEALKLATVVDLLKLAENGKATINEQDSPEPVRRERFVMPHNGDWGEVLLIHPPASVSYSLILPDDPVQFSTRLALAPETWTWGGDGATFVVSVETDSGKIIELFRHHLYNDDSGRDWYDVTIPLEKYRGQNVTLSLSTENGPVGDGTGDWAGWEYPRIVWE
jgi:hypothetical protein